VGEHKKLMPMTIGDILDCTFKLYRTNFLKLFLSGGLIFLPFILLRFVLMPQDGISIFSDSYNVNDSVMVFILIIFLIIFGLIYIPSIIKISSESFMDRDISIAEAYKYSFKRMGSYFLTKLLANLAIWAISIGAVLVSSIAIAILGVFGLGVGIFNHNSLFDSQPLFLTIIFTVIFYAVILIFDFFTYGVDFYASTSFVVNENKYGDAVNEGFKAAAFKFWRYCAGCIAIIIIMCIPVAIFYSLGYGIYYITDIKYTGLQIITSMFGVLLVLPIFFIMNTVFFYDYKIQKQGFGIEMEYDVLNDNNFKEV
jgi:hypothetical protein